MLFKAVRSLGEFKIETLDHGVVTYSIRPMDMKLMNSLTELPKDVDNLTMLRKQFELFCPEYKEEHLEGIPVETLTQMVTFISETAEGKNRTEMEKKTESKKPIKSSD